jgi:hypothetical protein
MSDKITALLSTFCSLLRVEIDLDAAEVRTTVIDQQNTVAFSGMTSNSNGKMLVVVRKNLMLGFMVRQEYFVFELDDESTCASRLLLTAVGLYDVHQIRRIGRFLCVVQNCGSCIVVFDLETGRQTRRIDLLPFVPQRLQHDADPRYPDDPYHFTSLSWTHDGALLVLAHNWRHGSFALEITCGIDELGPFVLGLNGVHEGLGIAAHDIFRIGETLYSLDSEGGRLIVRGVNDTRFIPLPARDVFPRGLAVTGQHILVAYGLWESNRKRRWCARTGLCVLDRSSLQVILDADVGMFGNSRELRVVSTTDYCDQTNNALG